MKYNIIDAGVSLALVMFLLPITGIAGYVVIICTSEILNFILSLNRLVKITRFRINVLNCFVKPIIAAVVSCLICGFVQRFSSINTVFLVVAILFQVVVYVSVLGIVKGLSKDDVKWFKKIFAKDREKCIKV